VVLGIVEHAASSADGSMAWTFDQSRYRQDTRQLPIGVFDSGIGGLTVLEAILSLDAFDNETLAPGADGKPDFQDERFIYLGDQANMPYGNYSAAGKVDYLRELILKDVVFLLGKRYWPSPNAGQPALSKPPVKAIAIGCNTATAYGLEDIKIALRKWDLPVPVVGVVEAGARGVLEWQQADASQDQSVAVLATVGTCNSGAYPKAISQTLGLAGRRVPQVVQHGFVELAAAIEGDPNVLSKWSVSEIIRKDILQLVESHRQSGSTRPIGSIVLGCTHFPLVQDEIVAAMMELRATEVHGRKPYYSLIAERIQVVNPAELTAKELFRSLAKARLRSTQFQTGLRPASAHGYFISVPNPNCANVQLAEDGSLHQSYKVGRSTEQLDLEDTIVVPMRPEQLPPTSLKLIRTSLPLVWSSLSNASLSQ